MEALNQEAQTPPDPRPAVTVAPPGRRIPTLDGLRALSIGMVFLSHHFLAYPAIDALGQMGVRIFFILSGFLITVLLMKERAETGTVSLRQFYLRRTLRIFPPCYAYIFVVGLLALAGKIHEIGMADFVHALSYTVNYAPKTHWVLQHLWSLGVEEQFYLLWPLAFVLLSPKNGTRLLIVCLAGVPLVRLGVVSGLIPSINPGQSFHTVADGLATGCLLARLSKSPSFNDRIARIPHDAVGALFLVAIGGAIAWAGVHPVSAFVLAPTLANVAIALFVAKEIHPSRSLAFRLLNVPFVAQVGVWSYSLYLWQQPLLFHFASPQIYHTFPFNYVILFALATGSYYLIERPCLRLRRYF